MRIDLSSILGRWNKTEASKDKSKMPSNYTKMPEKGTVIKGEIIDISQSRVTVRLEDGQVVEARMSEPFEFIIGDKLSFVVKESNPEQLLLTPILDVDKTQAKIIDILKNAGLPENDKNIEIVTKLIEKNMPINKKTLTDMSMFSKRFPDVKIDHLIFLMKNDIMISKESLHYVNELLNNKTSMSKDISTFNSGVANMVDKAAGALVVETILKENVPATNVFEKIRNFFLKPEEQVIVPKEKLEFPMTKLMTGQEVKVLLDDTNLMVKASKEEVTVNASSKEAFVNTSAKEAFVNTSLKEAAVYTSTKMDAFIAEKGQAFSDLFTTVEGLDIPEDIKAATNKLLAQRVTTSMLNNELMMHKEDLQDVKKINDHYNKVYNKIINVINLDIQDTSDSVKAVLKEAANIKINVEMMNQLQQNHQFVHIPMILNDENIDTELYVMNSKNSKKSNEERITALLRLDFRNLGHLDIYVAKTANNVEVTFYSEKNQTVDDLRGNTSKLNAKLIEKSFNVLGIGVMMKEKDFDIFEDFFDSTESSESKRFTFDMRA